jgi:hypothetical protein
LAWGKLLPAADAMNALDLPDPYEAIPSLGVLVSELTAYRSTGSCLHLAHAARALDDARAELEGLLARAARPRSTSKDIGA